MKLRCLKAGMTNKSFLFSIHEESENKDYAGKDFICRIPGVGTGKLINRREEEEIYSIVKDLEITEELLYFNPENGYKISRYYEEARNADFSKQEERRACMKLLLKLHEGKKEVNHAFSLGEKIQYYEDICLEGGGEIPYQDYGKIKEISSMASEPEWSLYFSSKRRNSSKFSKCNSILIIQNLAL